MLTVGFIIFPSYNMSKHDQKNWSHIFSIYQTEVMDFLRLLRNKQDNLNRVPNCSTHQVSYFSQVVLIKMNATKFGSLNLDTLRISYEFLKFESISEKEYRKTFKNLKSLHAPDAVHPETLTAGSRGQRAAHVIHTELRRRLTGRSLPTARLPAMR